MMSEMLKVREGRIRRILARSSILVLNDCGANGRAFQGCGRFKKLEDLALDVGRTVARMLVGEHMANYRAAGTLLGSPKGRVLGERESMRRADRDFRYHPEASKLTPFFFESAWYVRTMTCSSFPRC